MWMKRFITSLLALFVVGAVCLTSFYAQDFSAGKKEQRRKFGAIYMTMNNPFYRTMDIALRRAIEARGDILLRRDAALSSARQMEEAEALIGAGCEVLFLNAVDEAVARDIIVLAKSKAVLVVAIDTKIASEMPPLTVVSDNYEAGKSLARHLLSVREQGTIVLLEHEEAVSARERIRGFLDGIAGHEAFTVVGRGTSYGQLEKAMPAMEELLENHPDLDVVVALNDPSAMGAIAALLHANRLEGTLVYGVDGVPEARDLLISGRLTATAEQNPMEMARLAVEGAYLLLAQQEKEVHGIVQVPQFTSRTPYTPYVQSAPTVIELPTRLLTVETVEKGGVAIWK